MGVILWVAVALLAVQSVCGVAQIRAYRAGDHDAVGAWGTAVGFLGVVIPALCLLA